MATVSKSVTVSDGGTYTLELNAIPTGSSVTPTSNIQTWLHCADIWDKTYTTLAQVLADSPTLQALIASNNAVDYMVRSSSWASSGNIGLVPVMTSNTTPSGVASASSTRSTYDAYKAFNNQSANIDGNNHGWLDANSNTTAGKYLRYKFASSTLIKKVNIKWCLTTASSIKVQGSNNGTSWTDLSSTISLPATTLATNKETTVNLNNSTNYLYYQLVSVTGDFYNGYGVKAQLYGQSGIPDNQNAMTYIGANDYCANRLLANNIWRNAICNSEYFESVLNVKVPTMTSNTTPSGEAFASGSYDTSYAPWKAFNPSEAKGWITASGNTLYIGYKFTSAVQVNRIMFKIATTNQGKTFGSDLVFQGSNNKSTWTDLKTITVNDIALTTNEQYISIPNNTSKFLYYRLTGGWNYSGTGTKLQFYGRA